MYNVAWCGYPPFLPDVALMPTWTAERTWRGWIVRRTVAVEGHWWVVLCTPCKDDHRPEASELHAREVAAALNRIYARGRRIPDVP